MNTYRTGLMAHARQADMLASYITSAIVELEHGQPSLALETLRRAHRTAQWEAAKELADRNGGLGA